MYGSVHIIGEAPVNLAAVIWITKGPLQAIPWFTSLNLAHFPGVSDARNAVWPAKTRPAGLN
jgi:hypothetical protein